MEDFRTMRRQKVEELVKNQNEVWTILGKDVEAFSNSLYVRVIPDEGIERYTARYRVERQPLINAYISRRAALLRGSIDNMAEIIADVAFLLLTPETLRYEALDPIDRRFIGDMFELSNKLLEEARKEYYPG